MKNPNLDTLAFANLKKEYECKRDELQNAISQLIDKGQLKDLVMIEKVETATLEYRNAAKDYQEYLRNPGPQKE